MTIAINRRRFLTLSAGTSGLALFSGLGLGGAPRAAGAAGAATGEGRAIVRDVIDFRLKPGDWPGAFGFVTFRLHQGFHDGSIVHYIRTDTSDADYAERHGLVFVPLLGLVDRPELQNRLYVFENGQPPVLQHVPGSDAYTPLFRIHRVSGNAGGRILTAEGEIEEAIAAGRLTVEETRVRVNFPLVQWGDEHLAVDTERDGYLGTGQLLDAPDLENRQVTFKLHEAFPGSWYILTDTSAAPMAPMMSIPASPATADLPSVHATDKVWVFVNGIEGAGVMGFQSAIFGNPAGHAAWSPFWDHFALRWEDPDEARVLENAAEVRELVAAERLVQYNGTPNSHPQGFVVNCPVPVMSG
ncbi:DUF7482 domain-containing protein [Thioalkalivibrio paradoxus]|uniref:DUF7482 domain-containing protein n=1 Tax=Thioalkalivibrio paradoxus ARh 1 TaxID=713585 RepID=W0DTC8_9GAMM|nr:hypothetical protein [Thioalkalivibrio paradoxus]AHF00224.1 hypothetical protein THITH_12740 [Thioalkalivibrio paradoxus ARh 1]